jgi:sucrose-phosphate synthase
MYLQLISVHGLVRGENLEMGRDADTGGQVRYVVELARELALTPGVSQVDLFTRSIRDKRMEPDYAEPTESLGENCRIVRLPCGGNKYIRKERLWPTLDEFIDRMIAFTQKEGRLPDVVHGHYVDAGYIARNVASVFGVPFIFSGHSLGRPKRGYLLEMGYAEEAIERDYNLTRRIREEENCLKEADLVVTSTRYEREVNYGMYENAKTPRYEVIPPGLDLSRFFPYYNYEVPGEEVEEAYKQARVRMTKELHRFHFHTDKALILAICRPERRKNINMLIECYGRDKGLQAMANLAIFAGIRRDIGQMNPDEQEVLTEMLLLMDRYDLYGKMAVPKQHASETDIPELYRLAATQRGIFVSSAYVENFGLTFIESAATGLPWAGCDKGGPVDIVENTRSGLLVDLEGSAQNLTDGMKRLLSDEDLWQELSNNGINFTRQHYTWKHHCKLYLKCLKSVMTAPVKTVRTLTEDKIPIGKKLREIERMLVTDIDDTLLGDPAAFGRFMAFLREDRGSLAIGVATGRHIRSAREVLAENDLTDVDIYITSVGAEIYYGEQMIPDKGWHAHISHKWYPERIRETLDKLPYLRPQDDPETQRLFKISYDLDTSEMAPEQALPQIHDALRKARATYNLIFSHGMYLDLLPYRASKGKAIRYLSNKWGIPPYKILAAGNSGNDADMLLGRVFGIVVGNHEKELEQLRNANLVYFADASHADGIIEGFQRFKNVQQEAAVT